MWISIPMESFSCWKFTINWKLKWWWHICLEYLFTASIWAIFQLIHASRRGRKEESRNMLQAIIDIRVKQKVYSTIKKNERTSSKLRLLYWKICVGGLAVHHSKANKQARLVERKVCFISDAGNWGTGGEGGWWTSVLVQRLTVPYPLTSRGWEHL